MTKIASIILILWFLCILAVLPSTLSTVIYKFHFMKTDVVLKQICAEKWDNQMSHLLYSVGLMIVQVIMIKGPISKVWIS